MKKYEWMVHVLAIIVIGGFYAAIVMVMVTRADNTDHDILYMMLGLLGSTFVNVISHYFGRVKK